MKWKILNKRRKEIIKSLFENRNLKTKKEIDDFLEPKNPENIKIEDLNIKKESVKKILGRLKIAKEKKEKIVVFGDYDADGICATAILWETLYKLGFDAMPYIPDRFEEGYGIKASSLANSKLKNLNPKLIITVDNGIVAYDAIKEAKKRKIDVIVVDHHTKGKLVPSPYCLHSTLVCGSALAWFLSKELGIKDGLDLVALGTVADQMPLLGINRSLVKFGLLELLKTKKVGLQTLFKDLKLDNIGTYEVGYLIAPRINAMGRLANATDSLRFLCTRDLKKANDLNKLLNETNSKRQKIVDEVLTKVLKQVQGNDKIIVISGKYHEGVIGLASGKITEKFYRPSIVLSENKDTSKASARSIFGFNIIEAIKETGLIIEGGGHPMAAGFSIETNKISDFRFKINELSKNKLTDEILEKKLYIDLEISFDQITKELVEEIKKFGPVGVGNAQPTFVSKNVEIKEIKKVGQEGKHLKLKLSQNGIVFDAIWFNNNQSPIINNQYNIVYEIDENIWNNKTSIQLKIRDIKI
ncbi:MAG: single-stranded-DNA-specific exonuclease RecJ [Candidatus Woesebacteria bacterium]|nr:single-stranded-DNA-specific exonuclease RecJ [Candidatus Woesebacteria bacterium]